MIHARSNPAASPPPRLPALFDAWPALRGRVPWISLGGFPTRAHRVDHLLPPSVDLWVKREDECGTPYGGNKVRKLEFLLAEASLRGACRLATFGNFGSHHVLATTLYGRRAGFEVDAVLLPRPIDDHVRDQLLAALALGAHLHVVHSNRQAVLAALRAQRQADTCWVASGGSSVTGTLGYVSAGLELAAQIAVGELPAPDVIYAPLASCGTVAGLLVGLSIDAEIRAIRAVSRWTCNATRTRWIAAQVERHLALLCGARWRRPGAPRPRLTVDHRFFGDGYVAAPAAARDAVAVAGAAGLELEPTYSGRAFAALLADARAGALDGKRVLFVNTNHSGGVAALLASAPRTHDVPAPLRRYLEPRHVRHRTRRCHHHRGSPAAGPRVRPAARAGSLGQPGRPLPQPRRAPAARVGR